MGAGKGQQRRVNIALRLSKAGISPRDLHKITKNNPYAYITKTLTDFLTDKGYKIKLVPANNKTAGRVCHLTKVLKFANNLNHAERTFVLLHETAHVLTDRNGWHGENTKSYREQQAPLPSAKERFNRYCAKEEIIVNMAALTISEGLNIEDARDFQNVDPYSCMVEQVEKLEDMTFADAIRHFGDKIKDVEKQLAKIVSKDFSVLPDNIIRDASS